MSEKNLDNKNRWRSLTVGFRMSPEEASELDMKVALSGLTKQDYLTQCCLNHEVIMVGSRKMAREMRIYLEAILEELQGLGEGVVPREEVWFPLIRILTMLNDEKS